MSVLKELHAVCMCVAVEEIASRSEREWVRDRESYIITLTYMKVKVIDLPMPYRQVKIVLSPT